MSSSSICPTCKKEMTPILLLVREVYECINCTGKPPVSKYISKRELVGLIQENLANVIKMSYVNQVWDDDLKLRFGVDWFTAHFEPLQDKGADGGKCLGWELVYVG
jgi:hypothetical protein